MAPSASPTTAGSAASAASTTPGWPGTRTATPSPASSCPTTRFWNADLLEAADELVADHPRRPAPGAGDLRRVRRLRPPRPHPGAPRRDVRHRAGRRRGVQARPRRAPRRRQGLLVRDEREPDARQPAPDAGVGRHHELRGDGPRRRPRPVRHGRRPDLGPRRRPGVRRAEDGRAQAAPHAGRSRRPVLRRRRVAATRSGATSTTCSPRATAARWARTASRPTSSPGSEPVALVRGAGAPSCCRRSVPPRGWPPSLLHQRGWGLALGLAAAAATTLALPRGWWSRVAFMLGWMGAVVWAMVPHGPRATT